MHTGAWSAGWSLAIGDLSGDGRADVVLYDTAIGVSFSAVAQDPGIFDTASLILPPDEIFVGQER